MKLPTGHEVEFEIGESVYLKSDKEQSERIVTCISLRPSNGVTYCLVCGTQETWHFGVEITRERDIVKATTG